MKKTDEELRKIAEDHFAGKLFTDRMVKVKADVPVIFLPIARLIAKKQWKKFVKDNDVCLVYEYREKATGRFGAMPVFSSVHILDSEEAKRLEELYQELRRKAEEPK